jgi:hypothetical protein
MDISKFKTLPSLEDEGVWLEVGEGFKVKVCRLGCKRHAELYRRLTSPPGIRAAIESNTYPPEEHARMQVQLIAETILVGWEGLTENGVEVPYSVENAKRMLEVKDFRFLIHQLADQQANFRAGEIAGAVDTLKKSSPSS